MKLKYIGNWLAAFCVLLSVTIWYLFTAIGFPPSGSGR